ncbi:hypothetical protein [Granulicella arctica]|uniref:hypothetical protein n=1 Tax=Granulicella arctica TaxID=940613 RepID=UPI0021DFFBA5|nr:hypothetical protein [Granulicella arctica]
MLSHFGERHFTEAATFSGNRGIAILPYLTPMLRMDRFGALPFAQKDLGSFSWRYKLSYPHRYLRRIDEHANKESEIEALSEDKQEKADSYQSKTEPPPKWLLHQCSNSIKLSFGPQLIMDAASQASLCPECWRQPDQNRPHVTKATERIAPESRTDAVAGHLYEGNVDKADKNSGGRKQGPRQCH